jgi:hypothetical protein
MRIIEESHTMSKREPDSQTKMAEWAAEQWPVQYRSAIRDIVHNAWLGGYNERVDECAALEQDIPPGKGEPDDDFELDCPTCGQGHIGVAARELAKKLGVGEQDTPAPALTGAQIKKLASCFDIDGTADEILDFARAVLRASPLDPLQAMVDNAQKLGPV